MFERLLSTLSARRLFWLTAVAVAIGVAAFVLPLLRRSITYGDEGYLLLQSLDMLQGKVLYRDLDAFVTPGIWFVLAGTFSIFEPSIIASRIPVFIAYLAMVGVSYRIAALMAGPRAGLATVGLLLVCTVWAFPAWTFAFYSPFSVLFALAGLERILACSRSGRGRDLVWSGALFGVAIVFKQNYGVFALVGGAIGVVALHFERRQPLPAISRAIAGDALRMAAGVLAVGLPVFGFFVYQGVLPELFQSLVVHPFEFSGKHGIPYLSLGKLFQGGFLSGSLDMYTYGAQPVYRTVSPGGLVADLGVIDRLHVILYWIPPLIFAAGAVLAPRPEESSGTDTDTDTEAGRALDGRLTAVLSVTFFLYLGVFPRADFNHLINVYQGVVVASVVVVYALLRRYPLQQPLWLRGALGLAAAIIGLYAAVAGYWYWDLLHRMDALVGARRSGVMVSNVEAVEMKAMLSAIEELTPPGKALLTIPDIAMINFLAARPMPSAYYNLYEHHIAHDGGAGVVAGSELREVSLAITRYNDFFSDRVGLRDYAPKLVDYLETDFALTWTAGDQDYLVFRRRPVPVPLETSDRVLEHCEATQDHQRAREHLLFDSLYHDPGVGLKTVKREVETVCRLRVPEQGAELVSRIGVRKPSAVRKPGTLTTEIEISRSDGRPKLLFSRVFELQARDVRRYFFPLHPEYRIDLSAYAGEEVTLVFRTLRTGRVEVRYDQFWNFGTTFGDLRMVPRPSRAAGSGGAKSPG